MKTTTRSSAPQAQAVSYLCPIVSKIDSPGTPSPADQYQVLGELKALLHSDEASEALKLLARFKKRPNLLHRAALEVDRLVSTPRETPTRSTSSASRPPPKPTSSSALS
jgi:hypothetical protein